MDIQEDTPAASSAAKRHLYKAPWVGGLYDLAQIVALDPSGDQLTVQFKGGGYHRGPTHPRARVVCSEMEECIMQLDGVKVYRFAEHQEVRLG